MAADTDLVALLKAAAGVTAIVGSGANAISPDAIPSDRPLPAIAYTLNVEPISTIHGTVLGEDVSFSIACWAEKRSQADALAIAVQTALVAAGRPWSARSNAYDDETGSYAATVTVDWM